MGKKVAILLAGQSGDIMEASSVLKYKDELWGADCEITWFIQDENRDIFKHNRCLQLAQFPHGYGIPESDMKTIYADRIAKDKADGKPDWFDLSLVKTHDNKLDLTKKHLYEPIKDFDDGYFPAPHQVPAEQRDGVEYSNVSRRVFGVPDHYRWHPVLQWALDEHTMVENLVKQMPERNYTILLETFAGSGQSAFYTVDTTKEIIKTCREILGPCNFIFGSNKHMGGVNNCGVSHDQFIDDEGFFMDCAGLTIRQVGLVNEHCDLMIGISSGVSVATSAWGACSTPKIQWCGSKICSTSAIANGPFHLVESDFKTKEVATKEFFDKLREVLQTL